MIITDDEARRILIEALFGSIGEYEKMEDERQYFLLKKEMEEKRKRKAELNRKRLKKEGLELQSISKFEEDE